MYLSELYSGTISVLIKAQQLLGESGYEFVERPDIAEHVTKVLSNENELDGGAIRLSRGFYLRWRIKELANQQFEVEGWIEAPNKRNHDPVEIAAMEAFLVEAGMEISP